MNQKASRRSICRSVFGMARDWLKTLFRNPLLLPAARYFKLCYTTSKTISTKERTTMNMPFGQLYLSQLDSEAEATRKCLERITDEVLEYKPMEKSMPMKSLAITVSEIPKWIASIITEGDIDFATYPRFKMNSAADLPKHFDECMALARKSLEAVTDEELMKDFSLKMKGEILSTDTKKNSVDSTIRHLVHHRGQLTVYMRLNNIPIPKIYGPSGDDQSW